MSGDEDNSDFLSLVTNRVPAKRGGLKDESAAGDAYGTVKGARTATTLRLIRKNGKPVSIPYAYLPIIWGDQLPTILLIEYPGLFTVRLTAEDLTILEELIADLRVTWIRECSAAEAASLPVAVTSIELLRYYPSREVAGDPQAVIIEDA